MVTNAYPVLLMLLLIAVTGAILQMGAALREIDLERFSAWTCVAGAIACLTGYVMEAI